MLFARMITSSTKSSPTKVGRDEIVLILEQTSRAENSSSNKVWWGHFVEGRRRVHMINSISSARQWHRERLGGRPRRRLPVGAEGVYVYVTTHDGPTAYLAAQDLPHIQSYSVGMLVLNRDVKKRILSTTFDLYALTRSAL